MIKSVPQKRFTLLFVVVILVMIGVTFCFLSPVRSYFYIEGRPSMHLTSGVILNWSVFLLGILTAYLAAAMTERESVICTVADALMLYFIGYVVVSGVLYWIDKFTLQDSIAFSFCLQGLLLLSIIAFSKETSIRTLPYQRELIIPIIIIALFIPMSWKQFEINGMGQDQGVYQINAIEIISGENGYVYKLDEYYDMTEDEKSAFSDYMQNGWLGLYRKAETQHYYTHDDYAEMDSIYHGTGTFAALLALFGSLFGLENMQRVNILFSALTILIVYRTARNLTLSRIMSGIICVLIAFCPFVLWVTKSALTEPFLMLMVSAFLYTLTNPDMERMRYVSAIPIIAISFYHVSVYTVIPIVLFVYMLLYLETRNRRYMWSLLISLCGFSVGYGMMVSVFRRYSMDNSVPLMNMIGINHDNLLYIGPALIVLCILMWFAFDRTKSKLIITHTSRVYKWIIRVAVLFTILWIVRYGIGIANGTIEVLDRFNSGYYGEGIVAFNFISFVSYIYASGLVVLPVLIILTLIYPSKFLETKERLTIGVVLFYFVFAFSAFIRKQTPHYYYYSRYIVPYIPLIPLSLGIVLDNKRKSIQICMCISALLFFLPFDMLLVTENDDTLCTWQVFSDIEDSIMDDSVILVDPDDGYVRKIIALPLRAASNSDLMVLTGNTDNQIDRLEQKYGYVYYLTSDGNTIDTSATNYKTDYIYKNKIISSEDKSYHRDTLFPMPLKFVNQVHTVSLMQVLPKNEEIIPLYTFAMKNCREENGAIIANGFNGYSIYGPYINKACGEYNASMTIKLLKNKNEANEIGFMDIACKYSDAERRVIGRTNITADRFAGVGNETLQLNFALKEDASELEIRLYLLEGVEVQISKITIGNTNNTSANASV